MNGRKLDRIAGEHKKIQSARRREVARMVVQLGYEPQSWAETREIARDLTAGRRGRNEGKVLD